MKKLEEFILQKKRGDIPAYKRYLDEMPGVLLQDIWTDIPPISAQSKAAHQLKRRWIGIDVSPTACKLMRKKMESLSRKKVEAINLSLTIEELKQLHHFEFQNWVFEKLHGRINPRKSGDLGIDGWVELNIPTQVKQYERVGRVEVDKLETAIGRYFERTSGTKGYLIGFSFIRDAYQEVARIKNKKNMEIKLITVRDPEYNMTRRLTLDSGAHRVNRTESNN